MKNIKYHLIVVLSLVFCFVGCNDLLKDESITDISTDFVYGTPEGIKTGVIGLYSLERKIYNPGGHTGDIWLATRATNDLAVCRTGTVWNFASFRRVEPASWGGPKIAIMWRSWYKIVDRANTLIDAAEKIEGMDEQERLQVIAESKVARAHAYFYLYRWFTNIFVNTVPTTPENAFNLKFKVATPEEVYALLESDLDFAIEHLPWESRYGQYNQGVARHIRAKVAMWKGDWDEAALQSEKIINDGPYALLNDLNAIFAGTADAGNNAECIYTRQFKRDTPGGGVIHWAAAHFFPAYYDVDGMKRDINIGGKSWARIYPNDYLFTLYSKDNPNGKETDKRWDAYYVHKFYYNDAENLPDGVELGDPVNLYNQFGSESEQKLFYGRIHPATTKYQDKERGPEDIKSSKNLIIYRLAETYLIAAEAYMRKGDDAKALSFINVVRQRAGVPDLTEINQDKILEERARELALEGQRWFTLKRMGIWYDRMKNLASDPNYWHNFTKDNVQPHHVNWPIPELELALMPGFPQNPGY